MADKPKVYIVIYSLYHHIYKLSLAIKEGLDANGIDAKIFQVQETLSDQVLEKMHAPAKPDLPNIEASQLAEADGLIFGIPTRFGIFPAQMKALLDATGQLWAKGSLAGKFVATFFSTASQHGGQETTALNAVTYFAHHGLIYVPFGFANASMFNNDEVIGGSAYGSGTITNGDGSRQPSETELTIAKNQAENFAGIVNTYHKGKKKLSTTTGADSDASIRSLKAASHNTNSKETPAITTTNPEGQTTQQNHDDAATPGAVGAAAVAAGAGAGAGAAAAASKGASDTAGTAATESAAQKGTSSATANGSAAPKQEQQQTQSTSQQQQQPSRQQGEKPKKKKLMSWLCCSSE
ncbi:flavoprotein-like protein [Zychaea mexicana]|uniref:flavoprotein-like protein n=1 Tax=Zychaea mexicana TaxID=64656 RepID=UPI0022FDBF03|nr:flavoprotein-like protein [Zychaea mexicana]KAI9492828.1 flavoprotein-like protein [Zychaea mexicana]